MVKKNDGKAVIVTLEFAAKAAEEFLKAYNKLKAEIEEIKPLSPYQINKRKRDDRKQHIAILCKQQFERKRARDEDKIKETMRVKSFSWVEAVYFLSELRSDLAKKSAQVRLKNAQAKKLNKQ